MDNLALSADGEIKLYHVNQKFWIASTICWKNFMKVLKIRCESLKGLSL